ncbi:MAG: flagellar hook-basal body protein [Candidatus Dactylopiibacterium carminicum]|uniref:Flagellar hook-basal body complex protein FliE n=1 Tax=Candidatus Dactylopiibacterium carminicum TaxID=857335 RepID=A0A272EWK9_9RHOO|nr:flagellar hook-basal body complex protein FliE [Candidatus Dactylopiibacterium carminicum]KAF7599973.1 flagellar hook-basal body protein [Candidatus Dactylopiibacterium carminicum]PAS94446.1 MAG: flagellar hook-basal body protein [Candidatus Dactylopiibacterium carminicum]PAS96394.1 MAG: flagellar hook-basal body protein [Candidatus Dactylopiibacterium carminicum]PAS99976.1 MAG: hypothetical protein BSR46_05165 [Candidatus Dactylopiibacterium carminicum]
MAIENTGSSMATQIQADLAQIQNQARLHDALAGGNETEALSFPDAFRQAVQSVNEQDRLAGERMAAVDSGESDDLVGAMLSSQEAGLSFSMLMQVRNKVVGAVDELLKLQL